MDGYAKWITLLALLIVVHAEQLPPYGTYFKWEAGWTFPLDGQRSTFTASDLHPGYRRGHGLSASNFGFYMYGGFASVNPSADVNAEVMFGDLWKYNASGDSWTWLSGNREEEPFYPNPLGATWTNATLVPGARAGSIMWIYKQNLYLYGGQPPRAPSLPSQLGLGEPMNDLWVYQNNNWYWKTGGPNTIIGPTYPAPRVAASQYYHRPSNSLWMYGGYTDSARTHLLAEIWILENLVWKQLWQSASTTAIYVDSGSTHRQPGIRPGAAIWPVSATEMYLFGGGPAVNSSELWFFNGAWSLLTPASDQGTYPTNSSTTCDGCNPGARWAMSTWVDNGTLWLMGGRNINPIAQQEQQLLDTWYYNLTDSHWYLQSRGGLPQPVSEDNIPQTAVSCFAPNNCWYYGDPGNSDASNAVWHYTGMGALNQTRLLDSNSASLKTVINNAGRGYAAAPSMSKSGAVIIGNEIYVGFGSGGLNNNTLKEMWKYTPGTSNWTFLIDDDDGPAAHNYPIMWTNQTYIWLFDRSGVLWRYNVALNRWKSLPSNDDDAGVYTGPNMWPGARTHVIGTFDGICFWMFGGIGYGNSSAATGYLNDLWMFNTTTETWEFITGSIVVNQSTSATAPGGRINGVAATEGGFLWIYGGNVYIDAQNQPRTSEFWRLNISTRHWTLKSNSSLSCEYPELGSTSPTASPGARAYGTMVTFDGNIFLFAGNANSDYYNAGGAKQANDVWVYMLGYNLRGYQEGWYWLGGSNLNASAPSSSVMLGSYPGVYHASLSPAGRNSYAYAFNGDTLWFYGGEGAPDFISPNTTYTMADMWYMKLGAIQNSFSSAKFEWKHGAAVVALATNGTTAVYGPRHAAAMCAGTDGNIWMYGGTFSGLPYGDLWVYSLSVGNWTWVHGYLNPPTVYPALNSTSVDATPGSRVGAQLWEHDGDLWLFGGVNAFLLAQNDVWKFVKSELSWYWMGGANTSEALGSNSWPAARTGYSYAVANDCLWIFGGILGYTNTLIGDLWKFNTSTSTWTLMYNTTSPPVYTETATATPGARANATLWVDTHDDVWVYGGAGDYNDFWQFTSGGWVWVGGNASFELPVFPPGVSGVTAPNGTQDAQTCSTCWPGSRARMAAWVFNSSLYLFGGASSDGTLHTDVWAYHTNSSEEGWYFMSNSSQLPDMPFTAAESSFAFFSASSLLYAYGGFDFGYAVAHEVPNFTQAVTWSEFNATDNSWNYEQPLQYWPLYPPVENSSIVPPNPGALTRIYEDNLNALLIENSTTIYLYTDWEFVVSVDEQEATLDAVPSIWAYDVPEGKWQYIGTPEGGDVSTSRYTITWIYNNTFYGFGITNFYFSQNLPNSNFVSMDLITKNVTLLVSGKSDFYNFTSDAVWPGALAYASSWVVGSDLYMFGGLGHGNDTEHITLQNDVWRYSVPDAAWYYVCGSALPINTTVYPGGRLNGAVASNGTHMWHYAGELGSLTTRFLGVIPELWQLEIATCTWTLLSTTGLQNYPSVNGLGGSIFGPGVLIKPSLVYYGGRLYVFGGQESSNSNGVYTDDVWEFDLDTQQWYYLSGQGLYPNYYAPLKFANEAVPRGRSSCAYAAMADGLWIYGGFGLIPTMGTQDGFSDMWFIRLNHTNQVPTEPPTIEPTQEPTNEPTLPPPTSAPTTPPPTSSPLPTSSPTPLPTLLPTPSPTPAPTARPTPSPTPSPTQGPNCTNSTCDGVGNNKANVKKTAKIVGGVLGGFFGLLFVLAAAFIIYQKKRDHKFMHFDSRKNGIFGFGISNWNSKRDLLDVSTEDNNL